MTMLSIEIQAEILAKFFNDKRSTRSIARELGLNRDTIRRVVLRRTVSQSIAQSSRASILDPFKSVIDDILLRDPFCTSSAILNQLRPLGFTGGMTCVRSYVRKKRELVVRPRQAFLRLEFAAGEAVQVDWGEFGDVFGDGIKIHCFAMVLAHSRLIYIEFTRSEKFEDFIRCHENAFKFFGGITRECWYDNLTSAVTERVGQLIKFNSRFMSYMGHHHTRPHACNVARGNEKGRVEDLIKYIRMNFWPARRFKDFNDLNHQAALWRDDVANQREHRSTKRIPKLHFVQDEKSQLMPPNPHPYDTDEILSRVVPSDFHVLYETNRYSVPWTLTGITVTVRTTANFVKVFYDQQLVTSHPRSYLKHKVFTNLEHHKGLLDRKPGATREAWQVAAVKSIGPKMVDYIELLRSGERSLRTELSRILALATVYGESNVDRACGELLQRGVVGVASLEISLKSEHHPSSASLQPEPIKFENEKLNRVVQTVDLRRYDALLLESIKQKSASKDEMTDGSSSSSRFGGDGTSTVGIDNEGEVGSGDDYR
jgi:transposase